MKQSWIFIIWSHIIYVGISLAHLKGWKDVFGKAIQAIERSPRKD
jgi:hypothetical protein